MDQIKIGKFIADCRKTKNLTQMQLAEKLNITDRAVSKWETGKSLPDSAIMLELCDILGITVNDLLCGEVITMENDNKELEKNLLETLKQKEEADRRLLRIEMVIGIVCLTVFLSLVGLASFVEMAEWLQTTLILIGFATVLTVTPFMLKIEQTAGYYECKACGHRYVPAYTRVFFAMHVNRTRYMKCPHCGKHSWHKKKISKE